jgi:hypothetical protein
LDQDFQPFAATAHLHRAANESQPRTRWIEATIAAELAIKEYLVRKEPGLESLLTEIPAPPLSKLFGAVLEAYAGFRATKLSALSKGAEVRNRLLHRPKGMSVSADDAARYLQDVQFTFFELLSDLYPADEVIRQLAPHGAHRSKDGSGFAPVAPVAGT